jgi:hypothetical protein
MSHGKTLWATIASSVALVLVGVFGARSTSASASAPMFDHCSEIEEDCECTPFAVTVDPPPCSNCASVTFICDPCIPGCAIPPCSPDLPCDQTCDAVISCSGCTGPSPGCGWAVHKGGSIINRGGGSTTVPGLVFQAACGGPPGLITVEIAGTMAGGGYCVTTVGHQIVCECP